MGDVNRVREIFDGALERSGEDRRGYLESACAGDGSLRAKIEALIASAEKDDTFLSAPTSDSGAAATGAAAPTPTTGGVLRERPGSRIGPYKLLQLIGEGGFGSVFMAEQDQPVRRKVALKIIKLGMDTRQVVARFEQERQALAMMDHPNIARVLDAGATDTGRPFFVMELVRGDPIVEYSDKNNLSIKERLELFSQVCHAVQHAHTKGIIHRDIKPSNILVSMQDGRPSAKVIDFGIAKATSARLTEKTLFTEHRQLIGTPEYMSPEQAEGSMDVDTRTDVYSLGVLLYELLTGTTPFSNKDLRAAAYAEIQRIIREVEPTIPSTLLSRNTGELAGIAAKRQTAPKKLGTLIRGELDWIVMKALEKDRQRRYETANGLAMDIGRFLSGEAVQAAPPGAAYRIRKFVRRNRVMVSAGSAVAAALLMGMVAFAWQASVARDQRDIAIRAQQSEAEQRRAADEQRRVADEQRAAATAQRDRAMKAEAETQARADDLELVSDFQAGMLSQIDPTRAGVLLTDDVTSKFDAALAKADVPAKDRARQLEAFRAQWARVNATDAARELIDSTVLRPAIKTIDEKFKSQPLVDAQLRQALADRYSELGLYEAAAPLQESALATRRRVLGENDPVTLRSLRAQADLLFSWGRLAEAEPLIRDSLERHRRVLGDEHLDTIAAVSLQGNLLQSQGRFEEAEPLARRVYEVRSRLLGPTHAETYGAANNLCVILKAQGKFAEAERRFREAIKDATEALGAGHPETMSLVNNLGTMLQSQGRLLEAERCYRELLETRRRVSGETHPTTLVLIGNLGFIANSLGKLDEAERLLTESLEKRERVLGPDHPITLYSLHDMGALRAGQERLDEAEALLRRAWEKRARVLGPTHEVTIDSLDCLCGVLVRQKKVDEAERLSREGAALCQRTLGDDHASTLRMQSELVVVLRSLGRHEEAEPIARMVVERRRRLLGAEDLATVGAVRGLAMVLVEERKFDETETLLRSVVESYRNMQGSDPKELLTALADLISLFRVQGREDDAEAFVRERLEVSRRVLGPEHSETLNLLNSLGVSLQHRERSLEAEPLLREALAGYRKTRGNADTLTRRAVANLGVTLLDLKQFDETEVLIREAVESSRKASGSDSLETINLLDMLSYALRSAGKLEQAEAVLRERLEVCRRGPGPDHPATIGSLIDLGIVLRDRGEYAEAELLLREAIAAARRAGGANDPSVMPLLGELVEVFQRQEKAAEAEATMREALALSVQAFGESHPATLSATVALGAILQRGGKCAEALTLLVPIEEQVRAAFTAHDTQWRVALLAATIGKARVAGGACPVDYAGAEAKLLEAQTIYAAHPGPRPKDVADCVGALADLYAAWNKTEAGKGYDLKAAEWKAKSDAMGGQTSAEPEKAR